MAITIDSTSSATGTAGTTLTYSHTVGAGENRVLLVMMGIDDSTPGFPSSVTYNGVSLTQLGGLGSANSPMLTDGWFLVNPDTGTHDIVITKDSGRPTASSAISMFGALTPLQADSDGNFADAATSAPLTLDASASGMLFDCITTSLAAPTADGSQTAFGAANNFSGTIDYSSSYKTVAAGTPSMTWTFLLSDYVHGGVFIADAPSTFTAKVMSF
jgi:hypothetical protein